MSSRFLLINTSKFILVLLLKIIFFFSFRGIKDREVHWERQVQREKG